MDVFIDVDLHILYTMYSIYLKIQKYFCIWLKMYWLIIISRRQGGLCIISSPDCIFIVHVKKEKKNMFVPIIEHFVVQAEARSEQTQLCFLWFAQSKTYFHSWCVFMIHLLLLELPPSISVIDWFQKSSSVFSKSLVY